MIRFSRKFAFPLTRNDSFMPSLCLISHVFFLNQRYALYCIIKPEATREFLHLCTSQIWKPACVWALSFTPFCPLPERKCPSFYQRPTPPTGALSHSRLFVKNFFLWLFPLSTRAFPAIFKRARIASILETLSSARPPPIFPFCCSYLSTPFTAKLLKGVFNTRCVHVFLSHVLVNPLLPLTHAKPCC